MYMLAVGSRKRSWKDEIATTKMEQLQLNSVAMRRRTRLATPPCTPKTSRTEDDELRADIKDENPNPQSAIDWRKDARKDAAEAPRSLGRNLASDTEFLKIRMPQWSVHAMVDE